MIDVKIKDSDIRTAVGEGMDSFVQVFIDAINKAINGNLTLETMEQLNADQITLLAWNYLHQEVMDGGYVQLIYNGYGAFIFKNRIFWRVCRSCKTNALFCVTNVTKKSIIITSDI